MSGCFQFGNSHFSYQKSVRNDEKLASRWRKGLRYQTERRERNNAITHTKKNPAAVAKEQSNYVAVSNVTLIHSGNAKQALDRLFNVYQLRQVTEQEVVIQGQNAGDYVASVTPWGSQTKGFISSMDSTLTQNGHTAMVNIQGVEVSLESIWMYSGEIYSGGMEVVY